MRSVYEETADKDAEVGQAVSADATGAPSGFAQTNESEAQTRQTRQVATYVPQPSSHREGARVVCTRRRFFRTLTSEYRNREDKNIGFLLDLAAVAVGWLFAGTHALFGVFPFALGLICAMRYRVFPFYIGAVIGCLMQGAVGVLYLIVYSTALLLRLAVSYPRPRRFLPYTSAPFAEEAQFRILTAASAGIGMAVYELVVAGVASYTVLFALGSVFFPVLVCAVFIGMAEGGVSVAKLCGKEAWEPTHGARGRVPMLFFEVSCAAFLFVLTLSLRSYQVFGVSLAACFAALSALAVSHRFGALRGMAVGLLAGLPLGLTLAPAMGLLGLAAGVFHALGTPCALAAAAAAASGYAAYAEGLSGFLAVVPEICVVSLLAWPLLRALPRHQNSRTRQTDSQEERSTPQTETTSATAENTARMAVALHAVSKTADEAAKLDGRLCKEEYENLCAGVCREHCRTCENALSCASKDLLQRSVAQAAEQFLRGEAVSKDALRISANACSRFSCVMEAIGTAAATYSLQARHASAREFLAADYALLARVLADISEVHIKQETRLTEQEEKLKTALSAAGIKAEQVMVSGERISRVAVLGASAADNDAIFRICEKTLDRQMQLTDVIQDKTGYSFYLTSVKKLDLSVSCAAAPKSVGEVSGDLWRRFDGQGDRSYILLCDGMGSGTNAAQAAEICVSFLSELLAAGSSAALSIRLLNNLLRAGGEACATTVDLLEIDCVTGQAVFWKSGAAASYVKRENNLFRLRSRTVPVGLLRTPDAERVECHIEKGDRIIMVSDGVLRTEEDGWLSRVLKENRGDAASLAEQILQTAQQEKGEKDDMTVCVICVE